MGQGYCYNTIVCDSNPLPSEDNSIMRGSCSYLQNCKLVVDRQLTSRLVRGDRLAGLQAGQTAASDTDRYGDVNGQQWFHNPDCECTKVTAEYVQVSTQVSKDELQADGI